MDNPKVLNILFILVGFLKRFNVTLVKAGCIFLKLEIFVMICTLGLQYNNEELIYV